MCALLGFVIFADKITSISGSSYRCLGSIDIVVNNAAAHIVPPTKKSGLFVAANSAVCTMVNTIIEIIYRFRISCILFYVNFSDSFIMYAPRWSLCLCGRMTQISGSKVASGADSISVWFRLPVSLHRIYRSRYCPLAVRRLRW